MGDALLAVGSVRGRSPREPGGDPERQERSAPLEDESSKRRLERLVGDHFAFVWRSLRHLGVRVGDADDAAQQVFLVAARKIEAIVPASERSFLFSTAVRIASRSRRTRERQREIGEEPWRGRADPAPGPDEMIDRARARALLEGILGSLPLDLRAVFVSFEVEGLTMAEIAAALDIPHGTVASRLRRAREHFRTQVERFEARWRSGGGMR